MLKLGADPGGPALKVVDDQIGNPTSAMAVAERVAGLLDIPVAGTMHLTNSGEATWYEFTKAIFEEWGLSREVVACTTEEFPRPAPRPANSRLEKRMLRLLGLPDMLDWRSALRDFRRRFPNG
jgi:dTDP-4-dehydrorhamnose reductase